MGKAKHVFGKTGEGTKVVVIFTSDTYDSFMIYNVNTFIGSNGGEYGHGNNGQCTGKTESIDV